MTNQPITDETLAPHLKHGSTLTEAIEMWGMEASWNSVYENGCDDVDDINCHVQCCCDDAFADATKEVYDAAAADLAKQIAEWLWISQQD